MRCTSGLLRSIEYTICLRIVVLPAFGGDTIRPRWPLPIGAIRSTMRPVISLRVVGELEVELRRRGTAA